MTGRIEIDDGHPPDFKGRGSDVSRRADQLWSQQGSHPESVKLQGRLKSAWYQSYLLAAGLIVGDM